MSPPTDCPKCDGEVARSQLNVLLLQQRSAFTFLFVCTFLSFSAGAGNASEKKQPQTKNLLPTDPIPRYHWQSTEALALIGASRPVILVGTGLTGVATNRWTDEYLLKFWEDGPDSSPIRGAMTSTLKTQDGRPLFYYTHRDEVGWYNTGQFKINEREMMYNYTTVPQFLQRRQTESRGAEEDYGQYVQTPIFGRGGRPGRFGEQIVNDLDSFDWSVVEYLKDHFGWWQDGIGGTENTLWLGDPGAVTRLHFDSTAFGLLAQVQGCKHYYTWPPEENWEALQKMPYSHPCSDCSRVLDPRAVPPAYQKRFEKASGGQVGLLLPGDVLFSPPLWWHHVEHARAADLGKDADRATISACTAPRAISVGFNESPKEEVNFMTPADKGQHIQLQKRLQTARMLEMGMVMEMGGESAVQFFQAIEDGSIGKSSSSDVNKGKYDELVAQLEGMMPMILLAGNPEETAAEFIAWIVGGRFTGMKTVPNPPHHITEESPEDDLFSSGNTFDRHEEL